ncbi:MAG: alpha/beta fold hydrolase [Ilumatobacteraceae bacterium]
MTESLWTDLLGVEYTQRFYDVRGVRTRVLEAGDPANPPLVFLHGVNGHAETYTRNIGPHAEHFRVYSIDMVGHGLSDKPLDVDYEIPTYVDHVLDFFDTVGIERALLSGESLGGWVGARLTIKHADRVERLVLNTPGGLNAEPEVMARIKRMTLDAVSPPTRDKVQKRVEWLFKDPATVPPDLVETRYRIYAQPGYRAATERILCLQEMEIRQRNMLRADDLQAIAVPTLLVWSSHDPIAGVEVGHWTRDNIPDCTFLLMEDSGHWPQFEEAEKFNREHLRFLGVGAE